MRRSWAPAPARPATYTAARAAAHQGHRGVASRSPAEPPAVERPCTERGPRRAPTHVHRPDAGSCACRPQRLDQQVGECSAPRVSTDSATSTSPRRRPRTCARCATSSTLAPCSPDQRSSAASCARAVGEQRTVQPQVAAGGGHAVLDHWQQQQRVDVAAGEHRDHRRREPPRRRQQRGDRRRAGRLDDQLRRAPGSMQQRPGRVSSSETVTISSTSAATCGERQVARAGRPRCRRRSCASTGSAHRRARRPATAGTRPRRAACTPTTRTSGRQRLRRDRDARDQAAAADAGDDRRARPGTARGSPARRCPGRRSRRGGRTGGSSTAPVRSANALRRDERLVDGRRRPAAPSRRSRGWRRPSAAPRRSGMNTVARTPSSCAASATPCAWLPALAATTPRARSRRVEPGDPRVRAADLERPGALQVLALQPRRDRRSSSLSAREFAMRGGAPRHRRAARGPRARRPGRPGVPPRAGPDA